MRREFRATAAAVAIFLSGCGVNYHIRPEGSADASTWPPAKPAPAQKATPPTAASSLPGPLLGSDGVCDGPAPTSANAIEPGIGECELVRLKGKPPTDVLVGAGQGGREVQVLYAEPGAKELYFFVNNRLDRIVK